MTRKNGKQAAVTYDIDIIRSILYDRILTEGEELFRDWLAGLSGTERMSVQSYLMSLSSIPLETLECLEVESWDLP